MRWTRDRLVRPRAAAVALGRWHYDGNMANCQAPAASAARTSAARYTNRFPSFAAALRASSAAYAAGSKWHPRYKAKQFAESRALLLEEHA